MMNTQYRIRNIECGITRKKSPPANLPVRCLSAANYSDAIPRILAGLQFCLARAICPPAAERARTTTP